MSSTADNELDISINPPPMISSGGRGTSLTPNTKLRPRKIADMAPAAGVTIDEKDFTPEGYVGLNLIDANGAIARAQYQDTDDEAYSELARKTPAERKAFLNTLQKYGVYGNSKPSWTGLGTQDFSAVREAMLFANSEGVTLDVALSLLGTKVGPAPSSGGARIRTTPKEDLRAVFRQVSSQTLGRRLSDAEVDKFVKAYNRMEVAEARGGEAAPSVQAAAMEQIEATNPEEAAAMGALQLVNIIDQKIKGLG